MNYFLFACSHICNITYQDDDEDNNNWSFRVGNWTVRSEHIPIIVGIFTSAILIFVLITMYLIWRYCFSSKKDNDPG